MNPVVFNINDSVRVRLTPHGHNLLRKDWEEMPQQLREVLVEYRPVKEDTEGWSEWQLWELMNTFGKHCHNGCELPFETDIQIPLVANAQPV